MATLNIKDLNEAAIDALAEALVSPVLRGNDGISVRSPGRGKPTRPSRPRSPHKTGWTRISGGEGCP